MQQGFISDMPIELSHRPSFDATVLAKPAVLEFEIANDTRVFDNGFHRRLWIKAAGPQRAKAAGFRAISTSLRRGSFVDTATSGVIFGVSSTLKWTNDFRDFGPAIEVTNSQFLQIQPSSFLKAQSDPRREAWKAWISYMKQMIKDAFPAVGICATCQS